MHSISWSLTVTLLKTCCVSATARWYNQYRRRYTSGPITRSNINWCCWISWFRRMEVCRSSYAHEDSSWTSKTFFLSNTVWLGASKRLAFIARSICYCVSCEMVMISLNELIFFFWTLHVYVSRVKTFFHSYHFSLYDTVCIQERKVAYGSRLLINSSYRLIVCCSLSVVITLFSVCMQNI